MDITIRSEQEAWDWLKRCLDGQMPEDEPVYLKFENWPSLEFKFKGQDFDQSIPTRIMPPLLDAQREVHRLYCELRYGDLNLKRLKAEDREKLELNVKVKKGSSEYDTNLTDILNRTFESAISNMDSGHILIALISFSLTWGSNIAWKNWLSAQERLKEIEQRTVMSQLEKEKMALITRSYEQVPAVKSVVEGADEFRNASLHKLKPADQFELPGHGLSIDGGQAAEITYTPRQESLEVRIDDTFIIQSVASGETRGYRLKVKRISDGQIINLRIADEAVTTEIKDILKTHEWAKTPVLLSINARVSRGIVTSATLLGASRIQYGATDESDEGSDS